MKDVEGFIGIWLQNNLDVDAEAVANAKTFFELGLDSFGFIQLIDAIENEFSIQFSVEDLMEVGVNSSIELARVVSRKAARP